MSFTYTPHITSQIGVDANGDEVFAALQIPEGGKLNGWSYTSHLIGTDKSVVHTVVYEHNAFMIPIPDPDASQTPDEVWDLNVVKDTALVITAATAELEVDTIGTADTSVVDEMGVPALQNLMEDWGPQSLMPQHVKMITSANSVGGFKDATPDTFLPRDIHSARGGGSKVAESPSMALWALGSPALTATASSWFEADTPAEWAQLQYLEYVLEQAFIEVIGLTEAGAESPWADAATLLVNNLIQFFEETGTSWASVSWTQFTMFRASVTVPGSFQKPALSLGW